MTNPTRSRLDDGKKWLDKLRDCMLSISSLEQSGFEHKEMIAECREVVAGLIAQYERWLSAYGCSMRSDSIQVPDETQIQQAKEV